MPTPPGWEWVLLTDVARLETGHTPSRKHPEYWDGDIHWIGIKDARIHHGRFIQETLQRVTQLGIDNSASRLLPKGTVCLSRTASVGYALIMGREMATSQDFVNWVCSEALRPEFLMYALMAEKDSLRKFGKGTTHTTIYFPEVKALNICLPPQNEQKRIVSKIEELFSDLDAGVAALKRARANLRRYRASVLKSAVEGRLTAAWRSANPGVEPATELLARILRERRQRWEQQQLATYESKGKKPPKNWQSKYKAPAAPDTANLPELPNGWCWATVKQVGDVQLGRQRSPKHHNGPHMRPYLRVANVFEDRIDIDDVMEMNFTPGEFERYKLSFGDILLNEGQSHELVGRPAMYRDEVPDCCFTNTLVRFRAYDGLDRDFAMKVFLAYLKNQRFQKIASITVNLAHLGAGRFAELEFPLPSVDEQAEIVRVVEEQFAVVDMCEQFLSTNMLKAARLRQSILKSAFEGKLCDSESRELADAS
jgi:type I restriction enzyme S subunit